LLHHKSWTSFAARRTSRLTVWPAPVIHHRSCCTSLNCFNLISVVSSMWSPDSWSILKLRAYKGSVCRCLNFPRTTSGVAMDECPSGVSLFELSIDSFRRQLKSFLFAQYWRRHSSALETFVPSRSINLLFTLHYITVWEIAVIIWLFQVTFLLPWGETLFTGCYLRTYIRLVSFDFICCLGIVFMLFVMCYCLLLWYLPVYLNNYLVLMLAVRCSNFNVYSSYLCNQ